MDKSAWVIVLGAQWYALSLLQSSLLSFPRSNTPNTRVFREHPACTLTAHTLGTRWLVPSYVDKGITSEMTRKGG
ncbi:hypothetical protein BDQ17DRAFT_1431144 [Cyathus striatus]|nr:hypothetical protein BDQ17DRAFT_1431144 [Cyathus striatus]